MPWSGAAPNQTYTRTDGTRTGTQVWQEADGAGVDIVAPDHDIHDQDLATAIGETLKRDGGNQPTADLPMGGFKLTNLGDATARDQALTVKQHAQDTGVYCSTGGTANAITLTTGFSLSSFPVGSRFTFKAAATNTGAVTVAIDGAAAVSIVRNVDGAALSSAEIVANAFYTIRKDSSSYRLEQSSAAAGSGDIYGRIVKTGTVMAWATSSIPTGWLECNGAAVSRTTYAELFAILSTTYGTGDGSTTFNLPDYRGEFLRGVDGGAGRDPNRTVRTNRGDGTTGDNVGTKQGFETDSHEHSVAVSGSTSIVSDHQHTYSAPSGNAEVGGHGAGTRILTATTVSTGGGGSHSHAVTATGTAAATGGDETRPRNVNVIWIILASPAAASAANLGVSGFSYAFDTGTTDADPGTGKLRYNNATVASVTGIYISETDGFGANLAAAIQALPINSSLYIYKIGDPATFAYFTMGATATDGGTYDKLLSLTHVASSGTFSNGDPLAVIPFRGGSTGIQGPQGADGGIRWSFDSSTTMADPGSGDLRLNNATLASVTEFAISANNAEAGNPDISAWVAAWGDSSTTAHRGQIVIRKATATENYVILDLTSAITDNTTWLTGTVAVAASNGSFSAVDPLLVSFHRTGDKGLDGAGSGTVISVTAGDGLSASGVGATGGSVSASGTLTRVRPVKAETGTTYTFVAADNAKLVTFANASAVAVTLPQATTTFGAGWACEVANKGAGAVTITPTTSTIDGSATLVLAQGEGCEIVSDGTNYQITRAKLRPTAVTPGSYSNATVTVDQDGRITSASSGGTASWGLAVSASGGGLTIALKGANGNDPAADNAVLLAFRSATATTGTVTTRTVTAATSIAVSSGSTLGVTSSTAFRLWVVAFDDGGTVRMGVVNATTYTGSVVTSILSLPDNGIASSTAEGGAGGADSAGEIYTGTAVTSKPYRILGWVEWSASGVTAGTWTTTNVALVQAYNVGLPTPGQLTGRRSAVHKTDTFTSTTGTTWTDITGYSASLTPTSAANAVRWSFDAYVSVGASNGVGLRMVRGSTAIGVGDADGSRTRVTGLLNRSADINSASPIGQRGFDLPQSASSTTYKVQFFLQEDTFYFNRATTTTDSNVVFRAMSSIIVEEVMT